MKTLRRILCGLVLLLILLSRFSSTPVLAAPIQVGCDVAALTSAIEVANAHPDADVLELAEDCIYLIKAVDNSTPQLGPNGLPIITTDITINGHGATIIRDVPGGAPSLRFFQLDSSAVLTLNDATLEQGNPGLNWPSNVYYGGAIYMDGGVLNIANVTFLENSSTYAGGAIFNQHGTVNVTQSVVQNGFSNYGNAGIWNAYGTLQVTSSTFRDNKGCSEVAIASSNGTTVIRDSLFENNLGENCQDLFGDALEPQGTIRHAGTGSLTLEDSIVQDNESPYGAGVWNAGEMTISRTTFARNFGWKGGAIQNFGTLTVDSSTFEKNRAGRGGGIWSEGTLKVVNSTFSKNRGDGLGGGIFNRGAVELGNNTFARNHAGIRGGNLWTDKPVIVANTIFTRGKPQNCFGEIEPQGGNVRFPVKDTSCAGEYGNPKLGPLQDNGGPTHTKALESGSAAINAARASICLAAPVNNIDQRGITRVHDGDKKCDAGAFEVE